MLIHDYQFEPYYVQPQDLKNGQLFLLWNDTSGGILYEVVSIFREKELILVKVVDIDFNNETIKTFRRCQLESLMGMSFWWSYSKIYRAIPEKVKYKM